MARASTGGIRTKHTSRGTAYHARFRAYGQRRELLLGYSSAGMTPAVARQELQEILVDVRRGTWRPAAIAAPEEPKLTPGFHAFASQWYERRTHSGLSARTLAHSRWALTDHLLPAFAELRLDQIDAPAIDTFTAREVTGGLSPNSANRLVAVLAAILQDAVEYELIARNPAASKRRRLPATKPRRTYLDCAEHVAALLDAAGELDRRPRRRTVPYRRALLALLTLSGLRIGEALELRWRDVKLADGTLRVRGTKTSAAERIVTIRPLLRDELLALAAARRDQDPDRPVFATTAGGKHGATNVRLRILAPAVELANKRLAAVGVEPLPEGLSPHSLRRTFASVAYALGDDPATVMAEMGHTSPSLALSIYAKVMRRGPEERERLRALVEGQDRGMLGDKPAVGLPAVVSRGDLEGPKVPSLRVASARPGG
jgi:integrase